MPSRFSAVITFVLTLLLGSTANCSEELPNIILLMGDDHGWDETGYNDHPHLFTPILDEMAANGLRLDRFYAAHSSLSLIHISEPTRP